MEKEANQGFIFLRIMIFKDQEENEKFFSPKILVSPIDGKKNLDEINVFSEFKPP